MNKSDYVILVDMDDTIESLLDTWVECLNEFYGCRVNVSTIREWDLKKYFPSLSEESLYKPLVSERLWQRVKPIPGAIEYLKKLVDEGFTVRICTASSPTSYALKMTHFVKKYLPFLNTRLHCMCVHDKQMVKANVLLDDNYKNLLGGTYKGVLFNRYHNLAYENPTGLPRVDTWEEFYNWVQEDFKKCN